MKKKLNLISVIAIVISFLFSSLKANAQDISAPLFSISGATTNILCVNQNTPNREAVAQANILFNAGTEFVLELSDADGVFSDPATVLTRFTASVGIPPGGDIEFPSFPIPTDSRGENYSLRVSVSETNTLSAVRENIPIYYFDTGLVIQLTSSNSNSTSTAALCDGESTTLTVVPNDFPEYTWYFNADINDNFIENASVISGESGSTLENITQQGKYFVQFSAGSCNNAFEGRNTRSIDVIDFNTTTVRINESSPQQFCPSDSKFLTISVTDPEFTYQWFRDGVLIPNSDNFTLNLPQSNFAGIYTVNVIGSSTCSILTDPVEVINIGSDILTQPPPLIMLLPTQPTLTLSITTNAPAAGSTVQWFRNGIVFQSALPITDPGALSIDVTIPGVYVASVFANDVCMDTLDATTEVFEPVGFRTQISTLLDCDADTGTLGLENLFGITATGLEVPITTEQYALFDFEWFLGTQSTGVTETTFTVNQDNIGEVYALEATLRGTSFDTARSNELTVEFLSDVVVIDASPAFISFGETTTLSVQQSTTYMYEWFRVVDGENQSITDGTISDGTITGQGTNAIVTDIRGQYFVRITLLDCVIDSEIITISGVAGESEIIPNIVTPNSDGINDNWLLPGSLFNQQDVEVIIYSSRGQVDFNSASYQNNWPAENSKSSGQDPIYYYIITKNNSVVRKGSITVMR